MNITIADPFSPDLEGKLTPYGKVTKEISKQTEALLIRSATKVTKSYIDKYPELKLVIRGGVGLDNVDLEYAKEKGIIVRNTPKASSIAVAELAFALLISIPSMLIAGHTSMSHGKWLKKELKRTELYGKTICLVGMGNIGFEMAKRCHAFGMKVTTYTVDGNPGEYAELMPDFETAVKDADFISLHIPLTRHTENLVSSRTINMMKDGVSIINTSRGKCVNSKELDEALASGKVQAYAADVWDTEPPEEGTMLVKTENVVMTPHIGASTRENLERIESEIIDIIENYKKENL